MNYDELISFIKEKYKNSRRIFKEDKHLIDKIEKLTSWSNDVFKNPIRMGTRLDFLCNNIMKYDDLPKCLICDNKVSLSSVGYLNKTCSIECSRVIKNKNIIPSTDKTVRSCRRKKASDTLTKKYGVEHPNQYDEFKKKSIESFKITFNKNKEIILNKKRKNCIKKYGTSHPMQSEIIKKKKEKTNIDRYGFVNPMQNTNVKEKQNKAITEEVKKSRTIRIKDTNTKRYGVSCVFMDENVKQKIKETMIKKYGNENINQRHMSKECISILKNKDELTKLYEEIGVYGITRKYNINHTTVYDYIHLHNIEIKKQSSFAEKDLVNFLKTLGVTVIENDRKILSGMEIDILIPEKNIAFEFNGLYWHSTKFKNRNYHLEKTNRAKNAGIRLIHIFEDEWNDKKEIVKEKIKSIFGLYDGKRIFARKCKIERITSKDIIDNFYDETHIQGSCSYGSTFALKDESENIVAMMSCKENFGRMELVRFSTKNLIIGGFSKLFSAMVSALDIDEIISFADRRWSIGAVYSKNGFEYLYETAPSYSYVVNDKRINKRKFRKNLLEKKLEKFDKNLSELDNTLENGIYRIYDCGLLKYIWRRNA